MSQTPDFVLGDEFARILTETTMSLVCVLGQDGRILFFNDACERLTGFTRDEVVGRDAREFVIPPEEAEAFGEVLAYVWKTGLSSPQVGHWVTKDGERKLIAWSNRLMVGETQRRRFSSPPASSSAREIRVSTTKAPSRAIRRRSSRRSAGSHRSSARCGASPPSSPPRQAPSESSPPSPRNARASSRSKPRLSSATRATTPQRSSAATHATRRIHFTSACESMRPRPAASARCFGPARRRESAITQSARERLRR